MSTVRFRLAASRRARALRAGGLLLAVGLALFGASLVARRGGAGEALVLVGGVGALLTVLGLRRLLLGARPLTVTDRHVVLGTVVIPLASLEAIEASGTSLRLLREGGAAIEEEVQGAELAAVELARRAGMPPPRRGEAQADRVRYERRRA